MEVNDKIKDDKQTDIISKELLSAILGQEVTEVEYSYEQCHV